jgi:hypothetical protein
MGRIADELRKGLRQIGDFWDEHIDLDWLDTWDYIVGPALAVLAVIAVIGGIVYGATELDQSIDRDRERSHERTMRSVYRNCGSEEGDRFRRFVKETGDWGYGDAMIRSCILEAKP